jgi:hypothetical protein
MCSSLPPNRSPSGRLSRPPFPPNFIPYPNPEALTSSGRQSKDGSVSNVRKLRTSLPRSTTDDSPKSYYKCGRWGHLSWWLKDDNYGPMKVSQSLEIGPFGITVHFYFRFRSKAFGMDTRLRFPKRLILYLIFTGGHVNPHTEPSPDQDPHNLFRGE